MPSDKRARQRAGRQARMAELRQTQHRRRNLRRGGVLGVIVILAVVLALATSGAFSGSSKKKPTTKTAAPTSTVAPTTTVPAAPLTPTPASLTSTAAAALKATAPPAVSSACTAAAPKSTGATTTVPAKGNAVATIAAPGAVPFPNLDGSSPHYTKFTAAPPFCIDVSKTYTAVMKTDVGTITIKLLPADAPVTVNNFVFLAGYHYFDGIVFHRVVQGFVDQGGDPTGTGTGGPGYKFTDELPKSTAAYDAGALAMANSGANTNGSQFFLVDGNGGTQLSPAAYSMFGQVTNGINIVNKINADGSSSSDSTGTPTKIHRIESVTIQAS